MAFIEFPDLEQGSDAWLQARAGIVTASTVGKLITPTLKVANNETSRSLINTLAAERITGEVDPVYPNADMRRGTEHEPFARDYYSQHHAPVVELGFCTEDKWGAVLGCSPDGLVSTDGGVEIKSPRAKTHLTTILAGEVPWHYMPQCQTFLLVTDREWVDFVSFSHGMPLWVKRVEPDQRWHDAITEALVAAEERIRDITARYDTAVADLIPTERIPDLDDIQVA